MASSETFIRNFLTIVLLVSAALRNLSPAARSGVAVELESKAMWLSIEEGKLDDLSDS